jgi:hypothetical protein
MRLGFVFFGGGGSSVRRGGGDVLFYHVVCGVGNGVLHDTCIGIRINTVYTVKLQKPTNVDMTFVYAVRVFPALFGKVNVQAVGCDVFFRL